MWRKRNETLRNLTLPTFAEKAEEPEESRAPEPAPGARVDRVSWPAFTIPFVTGSPRRSAPVAP